MQRSDNIKAQCHQFNIAPGYCALAYQNNPFRLVRVFLPCATKTQLKEKIEGMCVSRSRHPAQVYTIARMIGDYYDGRRLSIPWEYFDFSAHTANQIKVYREVAKIPYGQVRSYGDIAGRAGMPGASRFIGNCMARNPYPIFIPCHRVIRGDGSLGGFGGGLDLKQKMLDLESR
jgi:methylated-DNA-[protein]-cysteine S-methyltransferase